MADVLGTFEQAVLLAILRLADKAYGRAILQEIETRLKREVAAGAVHATLERLENKGLVTSKLESGTVIRSGRPRRYYRLQAEGVTALMEAHGTIQDLWRGIRWPLKGTV